MAGGGIARRASYGLRRRGVRLDCAAMTLPAALFAAVVTAASIAAAHAGAAANEVLAAVQSRLTAGESLDDPRATLEQLDAGELKDLVAELDRAWPALRGRYLDALKASARGGDPAAGNSRRARVRELREAFARVKGLDEGAMKGELQKTSRPALDELRKLLTPTAEELATAGGTELAGLRKMVRELAAFRDAALDTALSTTPSDSVSGLEAAEQALAQEAAGLDRDGLRIMAKNREIAEDEEVPAGEAEGIEECNLWRLCVGLNALTLDPKLCEAARGHSQDMAERGFFAHESPVPGKRSFTDRAALAGTSASAENIFAGSSDPHGANNGWFYSPGHHKNMFAGHNRIGLGHHDGRWTQMFGR